MNPPPSFRNPAAFSLIELMVVMALVATLMTLGGLSMKGGGAQLSISGFHIVDLMEQARQTAILKQQPTALVMLSNGDDAVARGVFAVLGYVPQTTGSGTWKRLSNWEKLNKGVLADIGNDSGGNQLRAFMPANSPIADPVLPALSYDGMSFEARVGYGYVIFMPDGSLYQDSEGSLPSPFVLRFVEGFYSKNAIHYTNAKGQSGRSSNYFEITLNQPTGIAKITRP